MDQKLILIVEDDADVRQGLAVRLRAHGFNIAFAEDSITALNIARSKQPDLMILDIGLPGGDGLLMLERMQNLAQLSTTPVIIHTAQDPQVAKDKALNAGAAAFLSKPADNDELLSTINRLLGLDQA